MGQVTVEATIENMEDRWAIERNLMAAEDARCLIESNTVVDLDSLVLSLPARLIQQLGLTRSGPRKTRIGGDWTDYWPIRLTVLGRSCTMAVREIPDDLPASIGHLVLTHLDLVVDRSNRTLIGNPAHGGIHTYESY